MAHCSEHSQVHDQSLEDQQPPCATHPTNRHVGSLGERRSQVRLPNCPCSRATLTFRHRWRCATTCARHLRLTQDSAPRVHQTETLLRDGTLLASSLHAFSYTFYQLRETVVDRPRALGHSSDWASDVTGDRRPVSRGPFASAPRITRAVRYVSAWNASTSTDA